MSRLLAFAWLALAGWLGLGPGLATPLVAQEKESTPADKPLTPQEALSKVDQKVTVEMEVKSTGGNTARYLNSEADFRDPKNFAVYIPQAALLRFYQAQIPDPAQFYKGKTIRVTGMVTLNRGRPQLRVDMPQQIQVVQPMESPPAKSVRPAKPKPGKTS
jgi:DNA/RNA endonuclease YhcR with UshA esterase domain